MVNTDLVYTLSDLSSWDASRTWFAVLGHPIKHSVSPAMHNAALSANTTDRPEFANWHYVKFDIEPEQLAAALELFRAKNFRGLNLTVPHKVLAVECIHNVDSAARPAGAVNTLLASPEGWHGFNTDGHGMSAGIRSDLGLRLSGAHVVLLGAGGAARGAAVQCLQEKVASLTIGNRSQGNLDDLLKDLQAICPPTTVLKGFLFGQESAAGLPAGALLINATSSGLKDSDPMPINLDRIPRPAAVYDMIYNPPCTPLLAKATSMGIPTANGLSMLINQGAKALSIWTGLSSERLVPIMGAAARKAMTR